jgi:Raf kinase inhibitor-like YbhB/YbcL family protein
MNVTSASFAHGQDIPERHTADGDDSSPPLAWSDLPPKTRSLALIVEDPDAPDPAAPRRIFTHWIVYNLQPSTDGLQLAADRSGLPAGAREGRNDFGRMAYGGPSPPVGRHRYFFRLYALDTTLPANLGAPDRGHLLAAMQGHVLAEAELMGTYERQ